MTTTTSHDAARDGAASSWPGVREVLRGVAAEQDPPDSELGELAITYFARVPDSELVPEPADALATVRAHRSLARLRVPGKPVTAVLDTPGAAGRISVLVVTDDMPFLIDSVLAEIDRTGASVHRVVHPVIVVRRDVRGELLDILPPADPAAPPPGTVAESWMNIELGDLPGSDPARDLAADLHARLSGVLTDVREVVEDGDRMVSTARALADELAAAGGGADTADTVALLRWFAQGNLILLGYRRQELIDTPEGPALRGVLATGLGVLRRDSLVARTLTASPDSVRPAGVAADAAPRKLLVLTRASARSTVHRPEHPLYVGVSIHDDEGRLVGEHRFLGILTVAARHADVLGIPVVSRRVQEVVAEAGLPVDSWSGQRLLEVLQTYPRAELLCTDRASLESTATGVLDLAERRRVRLFLRRDPYGRYFSCMIYLPRDRYTTVTRTRMQDVLMRELRGTDLEHTARVTEDQLALLHVTVHTGREEPVSPDLEALTNELAEAARTWSDRLREHATGEERAVLATIGEPFAESYKEDFGPERGLLDLRVLDGLTPEGTDGDGHHTAVRLYRPTNPDAGDRRLKLYLAGRRATLSSVLPALQSLGVVVVDERPYGVTRSDGLSCWINDFGLRLGDADTVPPGTEHDITERFAEAFDAVWSGHVGADGFNALVLRAGLSWRQAAVLRAFSRYLRQVGSAYGQSYITDVVGAHRDVAVGLVELFEARFDPSLSDDERERRVAEVDGRVTDAIAEVTSLDADRILRSLLGVVRATLRTNYFRRNGSQEGIEGGAPRPFLALKLDPAPGARGARAGARHRDVRALQPRRGRAPAVRGDRARGSALVGPPAGLPHGDPGPGQGAGREERGDRPGGRQGWVRGQAAARTDRRRGHRPRRRAGRGRRLLPHVRLGAARPRRRPGGARGAVGDPHPRRRRALRRRRLLPGGRRRQGHRHVLRPRERRGRRLRVLAGRRVRLGRLGGLRPQGHGDHGPRCLGERAAALPRARHRRRERRDHRGRRRRHVRRRVRQRDAALRAPADRRRVRPPSRVPRPRPGPGGLVRRASPTLRAAALVVGRLRRVADQRGRRGLPAHHEGDPGVGPGGRGPGRRAGQSRSADAGPRDPAGPRRPAVERRHRHLRQGVHRDARRRGRQEQRRGARRRRRAARRGGR